MTSNTYIEKDRQTNRLTRHTVTTNTYTEKDTQTDRLIDRWRQAILTVTQRKTDRPTDRQSQRKTDRPTG